MRIAIALLTVLATVTAVGAESAATIDVPGAALLKVVIKSSSERDLLARQYATAFVLGNMLRAQAGARARTKAFTSAESARLADLEKFRSDAESSYLQTLPPACNGRPCEERFTFYRCTGAYELSSEFYRAVFDRFFTPDAQKTLAPRLSGDGSVWQGALTLAPNSHPFASFPAPSKECTNTAFVQPAQQTAGSPFGGAAPAAAPRAPAVPTAAFNAHADSIRRAHAAGVDTTVFGLALGQPMRLPQCPQQSLLNLFGPEITAACVLNDTSTADAAALVNSLIPGAGAGEDTERPFKTSIVMPPSKCPDWMSGCGYRVWLVDGRVVGASVVTAGLDKQKDVAVALTQKYKAVSQTSWKEWTNDAGNKVFGLEMTWHLPGLDVTFEGYNGGSRPGAGSILIQTDALTRQRAQKEKARQDETQKL